MWPFIEASAYIVRFEILLLGNQNTVIYNFWQGSHFSQSVMVGLLDEVKGF